jgi:molybdopterin synthase sulfurtransferase
VALAPPAPLQDQRKRSNSKERTLTDILTVETVTTDGIGNYTKIIDIRPIAAYNGWVLRTEPRGGHIPGAIAFPALWAQKAFDRELVGKFEDKGITPADRILIYGYGDEEALAFADRLDTLGYDQVTVLKGGFSEWAIRSELEVIRLSRFRKLVHPDWLAAHLAGEDVQDPPASRALVFHVNFGVPQDYSRGHIPGAYHLDTNVLESSVDWNRRSPEELEAALVGLGITAETPVILYGNDTARDPREMHPGRRAGQIAATRAAAILTYAGVKDVRLLDGGLNTWRSHGYSIEIDEQEPEPAGEFGATIPVNPAVFIDYPEAVELLANPAGALVSIRSRPENEGHTSGYRYISGRGDIPGAVWGDNGSDAYHMENYRNIDNTMRDFHEIAANWARAGITPDKSVSFYCGTGWRASETWFYAHLLGWDDVSIYDGGWFEWSRINGASV